MSVRASDDVDPAARFDMLSDPPEVGYGVLTMVLVRH